MRKARELTIVLLLALGALLIGGILFEQLHRDHLYLDLHAASLKTVLFAILAVVFLAAAVFCALYLIYNRKTKSVSVLPGIVGYFSCLILCSVFLTVSLSAVLCSYTTDVADLSGEPSQKLAAVDRAFPDELHRFVTGYLSYEHGDSACEEITVTLDEQTFAQEWDRLKMQAFSEQTAGNLICYSQNLHDTWSAQIRVDPELRVIVYGRYALAELLPQDISHLVYAE